MPSCDCCCHAFLTDMGCVCCDPVPGLSRALMWIYRNRAQIAVTVDSDGDVLTTIALRGEDDEVATLSQITSTPREMQDAIVLLVDVCSELDE